MIIILCMHGRGVIDKIIPIAKAPGSRKPGSNKTVIEYRPSEGGRREMICGYHVVMCQVRDSKMRSYGQVFWWLIIGSVGSEGVEMCQADGQKPGAHRRTCGRQERFYGTSGRRDR